MSSFHQVVQGKEDAILSGWLKEMASGTRRSDLMGDVELKRQATELLRLFTEASQQSSDARADAFSQTRQFLQEMAKSRMESGFSPGETAMFVLSLKQPIFGALREA